MCVLKREVALIRVVVVLYLRVLEKGAKRFQLSAECESFCHWRQDPSLPQLSSVLHHSLSLPLSLTLTLTVCLHVREEKDGIRSNY